MDFALPLLSRPRQKLLLHCAACVNRGPSNALCVLCALGWSQSGAEALSRAARPQANIAYKADAYAAVVSLGYS